MSDLLSMNSQSVSNDVLTADIGEAAAKRGCANDEDLNNVISQATTPTTNIINNNNNVDVSSSSDGGRSEQKGPSFSSVSEKDTPIPALLDCPYAMDPVVDTNNFKVSSEREQHGDTTTTDSITYPAARKCINPAPEINSNLDKHVEVRIYPCNSSSSLPGGDKKYKTFTVKPEGVIIQGTQNNNNNNTGADLGTEYSMHIGRKLESIELSDSRANQLLVTSHNSKSFFVVPAPETFSRHSGTCRLLGDRKNSSASHSLTVGDFLRIGSVGIVVIETHDGIENRILSEEKIKTIIKATEATGVDLIDGDTVTSDVDDDSIAKHIEEHSGSKENDDDDDDNSNSPPVCYMCFDEEDTEENPMITPCKCKGDTKHVHVECLRKWHKSETDDNQICFRSSVDATCSVCKTTFESDFKLQQKYGAKRVKLFKSTLKPPYVSFLVTTKHETAKSLFNTRFQLSFSTVLKSSSAITGGEIKSAFRPLLIGRSSGSDMILDYRTVSAHHASIKFKNGEFIFSDAGSSNGSYLYLRKPMELPSSSSQQPIRFRVGRSMITMKVVNTKKIWNRRLFRAIRRGGSSSRKDNLQQQQQHDYEDLTTHGAEDRHSIGNDTNDDDICITDGKTGLITKTVKYRTRESIINELPPAGELSQHSIKHLDLLYALAYPKQQSVKSQVKILERG